MVFFIVNCLPVDVMWMVGVSCMCLQLAHLGSLHLKLPFNVWELDNLAFERSLQKLGGWRLLAMNLEVLRTFLILLSLCKMLSVEIISGAIFGFWGLLVDTNGKTSAFVLSLAFLKTDRGMMLAFVMLSSMSFSG